MSSEPEITAAMPVPEDDNRAASQGAVTKARAARQRWLAILARAGLGELEAAWNGLAVKPRYRVLRAGETGLVMVRGRVGGTGRPFNLGEMTMTRAAVHVLDDDGNVAQTGFGHVAGRSPRRAELVAVFDALLQHPAHRAAVFDSVIETLARKQAEARAAEQAEIAGSKVEFFTLVRGE